MTDYHDITELNIGYGWGDSNEDAIAEHLTFIADIDLSEPDYSFDLLRFYVRKDDGVILYGTDAGCSCPSPFESTKVGDLNETTLARVENVTRDVYADNYSSRPLSDVLADVRRFIPAMKAAGAR